MPNHLAHFNLITLVSSPFLSMPSLVKLLSSWVGWLPVRCVAVQTQRTPHRKEQKEMGRVFAEVTEPKALPQVCVTYFHKAHRAQGKGFVFCHQSGSCSVPAE